MIPEFKISKSYEEAESADYATPSLILSADKNDGGSCLLETVIFFDEGDVGGETERLTICWSPASWAAFRAYIDKEMAATEAAWAAMPDAANNPS